MKVRSILLAAGRGVRLRPLTDSVAKPALVVGDRPLGAHALALLETFGPTLVNLSHLADQTRSALEPWASAGTEFVVESPEPLGTAGTVAAALDRLTDTFITLNADVLTDLRIEDLLETHELLGAPGTVAVVRAEQGADLEIERAPGAPDQSRGYVTRFVDRRAEPGAPGVRFIGAAVFERRAVAELLTLGMVAGLGEAILAPLVRRTRGRGLAYHLHEGRALDVGTPEALHTARTAF